MANNWVAGNDLIKGNDYFLYLVDISNSDSGMTSGMVSSSKVVAYAQSCSMEINADTLDVTSKLSCRWNAVLPGNASYTVNSDSLYCKKANADANSAYTIDHLFEDMVAGNNIGWVMAQDSAATATTAECGEIWGPDTTLPYYWGEAAITSLSINAGNNEIVNSSITLTGSGRPHQGGNS